MIVLCGHSGLAGARDGERVNAPMKGYHPMRPTFTEYILNHCALKGYYTGGKSDWFPRILKCLDCGGEAEHIAIPGGFPSCRACTRAWEDKVLHGDPDAPDALKPKGTIHVTPNSTTTYRTRAEIDKIIQGEHNAD